MSFQKGISGNPSGRPKLTEEFKMLLLENTTKALSTLCTIMSNPNERAYDRIAAAKYILDKALGMNFQMFDESDMQDNELKVVIRRAKEQQ